MAEHSGHLLRVAGIVSAIAIAILVNPYYGAGMVASQLYDVADCAGFIPEKISLFTGTYMKNLATLGLFFYGGTVQRLFAILTLSSNLSPSFTKYLLYKIDDIAQNFFGFKGIKLEAFEAPLGDNKQMSYEKIKNILNDRTSYKIDPAHCSKSILSSVTLPQSHKFEDLLTHFETINWESKYNLLKDKLATDARFIDFIQETFPEISKEELKNTTPNNPEGNYPSLNNCICQLAKKKNQSKEQYAAQWVHQQIILFLEKVKGRAQADSIDFLQTTIDNTAKILPCLQHMKENNSASFEEILLNLAISGGYPPFHLKMVSSKLLVKALKKEHACDDPILRDEIKMKIAFQNLRFQLVEKKCEELFSEFPDLKSPLFQRLLFSVLSLGFLPSNKVEFDFLSIIPWEVIADLRREVIAEYESKIGSHMKDSLQGVNLVSYMRELILRNNTLTKEQKDEFNDQINQFENSKEMNESFRRLILVSLNILRKS